MSAELIVGGFSMFVFFLSFFFYERNRQYSLSSIMAMNDFFSGIFFLRNTNFSLICARASIFLGIPVVYFFIYVESGLGVEYFPSITSMWIVAIYFYGYSIFLNENEKYKMDFFYELFFSRRKNIFGIILWCVRAFFIFSIIYAFIYRE